MTTENEISEPEAATPPKESFSKRLRAALETLEEGKAITLRTKEDRQTITNAVLAIKKKRGFVLTTEMLQRRDDSGRMVIMIKRNKDERNERERTDTTVARPGAGTDENHGAEGS